MARLCHCRDTPAIIARSPSWPCRPIRRHPAISWTIMHCILRETRSWPGSLVGA